MNDDFERIKPFLTDYVNEITQKSQNGGKNQYICPLCGSGTGSHRSGAFTVYPDNNRYYCFSCEAKGDIFDLYGAINNISDIGTIIRVLKSKYGIVSASQPIRQKKQSVKPIQTKSDKNYTKFFELAETHLNETDYLTKRGISLQTQHKFRCGYVENFTYKNNQTTSAVIIPTSNTSYMWRSTTENIKRKRGTVHIFNPQALENEYCFVVEGEIDCMSIDDCGFACIGLGSTSNIRKIFDHDTSKTVLILALDNDKTGNKATVELAKLCDEYGVPYITAEKDIWSCCKDANELLVKDRSCLIASLQTHSERAVTLDKDKWLLECLDRQQADSDWRTGLLRNQSDNAIKNNLHNIHVILENDAKYRGKIRFNELKQMRIHGDDDWSDYSDCCIKLYLEEEYGVTTSVETINQACTIIERKYAYHPIKDYLNAVQWDGIPRIKSVFSDFLGANDNLYTRSVAVVTFVGAVARIFEPGVKFDTCTVFVGKHGIGKSKFISKIAVKPEWFTDGVTTFDGKDFYESIQGK
ncbi:MAG: toprim domain-containing protein [Ruminococcus sp.]|nr:toprim domain-containing protein [Ruminococcus sp.]